MLKENLENAPTPAAAPTKAAAVKEPLDNKHEKPKEKFVGTKELSPAELPTVGGASSPQDVEKLSLMIDKTMELLKMLPEGFLQNAVK